MSAVRITKEQVEAAAAAREKALEEDADFRRFEEEPGKEIKAAGKKTKKGRKEKD